jgi:hypothetical protein
MNTRILSILSAILILPALACFGGNYSNFDVAIYIPVGVVRSFEDPKKLQDDWNRISAQLNVDKVYIEVQRNRDLASDDLLEHVKKFFLDHGVRVAGGMALSDGGFGPVQIVLLYRPAGPGVHPQSVRTGGPAFR